MRNIFDFIEILVFLWVAANIFGYFVFQRKSNSEGVVTNEKYNTSK